MSCLQTTVQEIGHHEHPDLNHRLLAWSPLLRD